MGDPFRQPFGSGQIDPNISGHEPVGPEPFVPGEIEPESDFTWFTENDTDPKRDRPALLPGKV